MQIAYRGIHHSSSIRDARINVRRAPISNRPRLVTGGPLFGHFVKVFIAGVF